MEKAKYLIGDVANLMGLSRDTLRYYEKRGLLSSEKGGNGYRYYTDQDVSRLLSILYQRKMNIGLDDIAALWSIEGSIEKLSHIIDNRLEEEKLALRRHQQTVTRLQMSLADCENIQNHLNQVLLKNFPCAYVIEPHADMHSSVELWFQYAKNHPGLDMMYLYDEYTWERDGDVLYTNYRNSQLLLGQEYGDIVDYQVPQDPQSLTQPALCVSTFRTSVNRVPSAEDILPMIQWAEEQDLVVSHQLFCTFTTQGISDGQQMYFLQLYLPVF